MSHPKKEREKKVMCTVDISVASVTVAACRSRAAKSRHAV